MTLPQVEMVRVAPIVPQLIAALQEALKEVPRRQPPSTQASDGQLFITVRPIDEKRVIVLGARYLPDFAPLQGRDANGKPICEWYVSIARYYDIAWVRSGFEHAAETILEDFALDVFEREAYQHQTLR